MVSGGLQQRLALCIATHANPLRLLAEPTAGRDPPSRGSLWRCFETLRDDGRSITLTTSSTEQAQAVDDRAVIIDHGTAVIVCAVSIIVFDFINIR